MSEFMVSDQNNETVISRFQQLAGLIGMSVLYAGIITGVAVKSLQERARGSHHIEAAAVPIEYPTPPAHENPFQS